MVVCAELYAQGRPRHRPRAIAVQRREAVLRLRPGQRAVLPARASARRRSCGRARRRRRTSSRSIERHRPTLFFSVPTSYGDAARRTARRRPTSICRSVRLARLGRRGAAAGALRALQAALRRRHPRRHRIDRDPAHLHLEPARRDPPGLERARRARLRRATARRRRSSRWPPARSAICWIERRLDLRRLLEPAREDQGDHRGPLDPHRRQVLAGRRRLLLVRRPLATTCSRSAAIWVSPVEVENALDRARGRAGMRRRRPRGSRRADEADARSSCCAPGVDGTPELARSCSTSCASGWRSTSGRAGSSSWQSCRRRRPARSSGSSSASWLRRLRIDALGRHARVTRDVGGSPATLRSGRQAAARGSGPAARGENRRGTGQWRPRPEVLAALPNTE